ncbi:uncharacterized protein H6S33_008504 [Morchella sextelata]|uniref:uncharacterized protein n=1 Tax=Morchella sextelata TaxID=1174677 RepID=UPI001D037EB9|nr:uncharacterized protein H6S33_008504 [Morchella sextelata]KAH0602854.1 hypothetical protein H6S33_008504 [Morchella sextelata]
MSTYAAEIEAILAAVRARIEAEEGERYEIVELSGDPMPDAPTTAAPGMAEFYGYGRRLEDIGEEQQEQQGEEEQQEGEGQQEQQQQQEEGYVNRYATNEDIARELGIPGFGGLNTIPHPRRALFPPPPTPLSESESEPEDTTVPEHMQCGICLCRQITLAYNGCTHGACRTCVKRICATQGPQSTFPCHVCRALVAEVGPLVEREGAEGLRWSGWDVERWVPVVEWVMGVSARVRGRWGRWL